MRRGQLIERRAYELGAFQLFQLFQRIERGVGQLGERLDGVDGDGRGRRCASLVTLVIAADIDGHGVQPRLDARASCEGAGLAMHLHEDVLRDVFHPQAAGPHAAADQVQHAGAIAREQIGERMRIAARVGAQ